MQALYTFFMVAGVIGVAIGIVVLLTVKVRKPWR
jgi:hypothetical protein